MKNQVQRNHKKEFAGWVQIVFIMLAFPALYFLCVFFPIWMGWTPRFP